jgi:hypothetical protein
MGPARGTFILFVLCFAAVYLSYRTAKMRGRSVKAWLWLGVLFGPFAWLTVAHLPPVCEARPV